MTDTPNDTSIEDRVVRLHDYQHALAALSRAASESLPPERLMHHVAAQVSRVTHVKRTKIMRYRPDRGDLLVEAGVGWKPGVVGSATFPIDSASPPGRAIQTARPIVIEDLPNDPEFRMSELLRDHGIVSLLNVPVLVDSRTWGVLEIDSDAPRGFDEGDITFLVTAANILGVALRRFEGERKAAEEAAEFARARAEAEVLLRELQHRVKNNLQTIISFLSIQRRHAKNSETHDRLGSVMNRVHAIALAHDQLALKENAGQVEFGGYLRALCANLDPQQGGIVFDVVASANLLLSLDRAVPAGLIVNELVTNSLKYAFDEKGGTIRVSFTADPDYGEALLAVEDDGRGIDENTSGGMGLKLVEAFAAQLGGRLQCEGSKKGTRMSLRFPLPT